MSETGTTATATRNKRRLRQGVVASDKGDKTIRVVCQYQVRHPKYGKYLRRRIVIHAHDENNQAKEGDRVEVMVCRPVSKTKAWRLVRVLGNV